MGKVNAWYRSIPLWLAIFLFAVAAILGASVVSSAVSAAADRAKDQIAGKYADLALQTEDGLSAHFQVGETIDSGLMTYSFMKELLNPEQFSPKDYRLFRLYQIIGQYAPVFFFSVFLLIAVLLFYHTKLKRPLALLSEASAKIADNDFAFSLAYDGRDEMADLCGAFEKMRSALEESNRRMHQMILERKQLNDAYAHDLRTPVAVLKGYTDTLEEYLPTGQLSPEKVLETVHTMSAHVERLGQFVQSMNTAQKLADLTVRREAVPAENLNSGLRETTMLLCAQQGIRCSVEAEIHEDTLFIDPSAVTQVFENVLGNALRFAKTKISVFLESDGRILSITVSDDGRGFTEKELTTAAKPYYSAARIEQTYHFGLGLYICRTLCEKHGGRLELANGESGGACVTASFGLVK